MRNPNILLTNDEIAIVNNLLWEKPVREIAAKIGRSLMALHYYLKHRDNYPPRTENMTGSYSPKEKDKQQTSPVLVTTTTTTSRITPAKRPRTEPTLQQYQRKERLEFAKMYLAWSEEHWRRVVFQDERKFNLDGPDGFTYYYHDMRNYERVLSQRPRGGSVFIWLSLSYTGTIRCEMSKIKFKEDAFFEFIQKDRTNIPQQPDGNPDYWLQDHSFTFRDFTTLQNWAERGIKRQRWPELAHDLDIMESVWGWIIREVYDGGKRYSRRDDLMLSIQLAWDRLPVYFIQNLYSTLPDRVMEVFSTNGFFSNC